MGCKKDYQFSPDFMLMRTVNSFVEKKHKNITQFCFKMMINLIVCNNEANIAKFILK